jgi:hypothetical protein
MSVRSGYWIIFCGGEGSFCLSQKKKYVSHCSTLRMTQSLLDKHTSFLNSRTVEIYRKRVTGLWLWTKNHGCTYGYRSPRGKKHGALQHPISIRKLPDWLSTGFRLVLNDTAHVERSHNIRHITIWSKNPYWQMFARYMVQGSAWFSREPLASLSLQ